MSQVRASRLEGGPKKPGGFLSEYLPIGSWKRKIVLWIAVPLLCLFVFYLIMDNIVMMAVTRHGSEFTLPEFTNQTKLAGSFRATFVFTI